MPIAPKRRSARRFGTIVVACGALLSAGCSAHIPLVADGKWRAVYAVQVQDTETKLAVKNVTARRVGCARTRTPQRTQLRLLLVESFQSLDGLPDRIEDAPPREDGFPVRLADSGPYDLTLPGASRLMKVDSGKQLLVRTDDNCAALLVTQVHH